MARKWRDVFKRIFSKERASPPGETSRFETVSNEVAPSLAGHPGLLSGEEIDQAKIIEQLNREHLRAISYDFSIGTIISPEGKEVADYDLPAQGIVEVVSQERVTMPGNVAAFATVKTSLCNEGLLALSIGIIDPGYRGKVSSFLVNFSRTKRRLAIGDPFLRATFHRSVDSSPRATIFGDSDGAYVRKRQDNVVAHLGPTFLNTDEVIRNFLDSSIKRIRQTALGYVGLAALGLALLTFLLNFGTFVVIQKWAQPKTALDAPTSTTLMNVMEKNENLSVQVHDLQREIETLKNRPRPKPTKGNVSE